MADALADNSRQDEKTAIDKVLAAITGFGEQLIHYGSRLEKLEARHDDDSHRKDESEKEKEKEDKEEEDRKDRQRRHDAWKHFSGRKDEDDDKSYKDRHDAEEKELCERFEKEGEPKEKAADRAKRGRKDAEKCDDDAKHFKNDDDGKRDAEEESLKERLEKEGEKKSDAVMRAHWARGRRDAADSARRDAAKKADDDAKKKADDDAKKDRKDSQALDMDAIRQQVIAEMRKGEPSEEDRSKLAQEQADADRVATAFGDHAPRPMHGELFLEYQRRMVKKYQEHSPKWKETDISKLPPDVVATIKKDVYADAIAASKQPPSTPGYLREIRKTDVTGRTIYEFVGEPISWMSQFMPDCRVAHGRWNTDTRKV